MVFSTVLDREGGDRKENWQISFLVFTFHSFPHNLLPIYFTNMPTEEIFFVNEKADIP